MTLALYSLLILEITTCESDLSNISSAPNSIMSQSPAKHASYLDFLLVAINLKLGNNWISIHSQFSRTIHQYIRPIYEIILVLTSPYLMSNFNSSKAHFVIRPARSGRNNTCLRGCCSKKLSARPLNML